MDVDAVTSAPDPQESVEIASASAKRARSPESSSPSKKARADDSMSSEGVTEAPTDAPAKVGNAMPAPEEKSPRSEKDVGITEYLTPHLPAFEAIIKQRFSDFQVFEVPLPEPGSTIIPEPCHITSLDPPGTLLEALAQERAEREDPSLREARWARERTERDEARRKRDEEEARLREAQGVWPEVAETKLTELLGERVKEEVKKLFLEGPKQDAGGGGRGGRGRGRGRGGGGGRGGGTKDTRCVVTDTLDSKDARTAVHKLIRELFEGQLSTEATVVGDATTTDPVAADEAGTSASAVPQDAVTENENASAEPTNEEDKLVNPSDEEAAGKAASAALDAAKASANAITIRWGASGGWNARRGDPKRTAENAARAELPPFIHFLLQKTNRESHDALKIIARTLGLVQRGAHSHGGSARVSELGVAGTKDRRGITVQRVTLARGKRTIEEVWKTMNGIGREADAGGARGGRGRGRGRGGFGNSGPRRSILDAVENRGERGVRIAHVQYADSELRLGQLYGNAFNITLRNVKVEDPAMIEAAMKGLREKGFINYFGMQRFGTAATGTHEIGVPLFQGDYERACKLLLQTRGDYEGEEVCEARRLFAEGDTQGALDLFPRSFVAERAVMEHVRGVEKKGGKRGDWESAFTQIPRTLRIMYVHAYQSYVWNHMVSERLKRFGSDKPVIGDYVLLGGDGVDEVVDLGEDAGGPNDDELGDDEEALANGGLEEEQPQPLKDDDEEGANAARPHILTAEDVDNYTIHDVVMPMPGKRVMLQKGSWMADLHAEMLAKDGLDVAAMGNAKVFDYALRGTFRKILHRPTALSHRLIRYADPDVPLCQSDEEKILGMEVPPVEIPPPGSPADTPGEILGSGPFLALCVQLTLSSSAYATMALREVLKTDTSAAAQREASRRSDDQHIKRRTFEAGDNGDQGARGGASSRGRDAGRSGRGGDRDRGRGGRGRGDRGRDGRGGGRHDAAAESSDWAPRDRLPTDEVNRVAGAKQRVWGASAEEGPSSEGPAGPAQVTVSAAAQEEFRRAKEAAQMMEEMEDERRGKS